MTKHELTLHSARGKSDNLPCYRVPLYLSNVLYTSQKLLACIHTVYIINKGNLRTYLAINQVIVREKKSTTEYRSYYWSWTRYFRGELLSGFISGHNI